MTNALAIQRHRVRITVLKKYFDQTIVDQFAAGPETWTACTHFEVGQEFETTLDSCDKG